MSCWPGKSSSDAYIIRASTVLLSAAKEPTSSEKLSYFIQPRSLYYLVYSCNNNYERELYVLDDC
jgi:hypothetical protein